VASRRRPTHHHRHQHATPGGAAPTICAAVALSVNNVYAIRGAGAPRGARCAPAGAAPRADSQLPNDGPQGGDQPPSRWRGQSHHHRAQLREASRHQGSQPREILRPACASGCAPSCTCTSPPGSPQVWGGARRWPHTCVWWSGRPSSDSTYQRSTMGRSTPPSSCRSTPHPFSRQGAMRLSWPTTSPVALTGTARS
jgi:hypothetical protein